MSVFITKPCETCGVPVKDKNDPSFTGRWTCYYCHCIETGRDVKTALNCLAEMLKTGLLVPVVIPPGAKPS